VVGVDFSGSSCSLDRSEPLVVKRCRRSMPGKFVVAAIPMPTGSIYEEEEGLCRVVVCKCMSIEIDGAAIATNLSLPGGPSSSERPRLASASSVDPRNGACSREEYNDASKIFQGLVGGALNAEVTLREMYQPS